MRKLLAVLLVMMVLCTLIACDNDGGDVDTVPTSSESEQPTSSEELTSSEEPTTTTTTTMPEESTASSYVSNTTSTTTAISTTTTNATVITTTTSAPPVDPDETTSSEEPTTTTTATVPERSTTSSYVPNTTSTTTSTTTSSTTTTTTTTTTVTTTTTAAPLIDPEEPVTFNTAVLFDGQHSSVDEQAETLRQSILNATDTIKPSTDSITYYVSYKGNDANDGLSPETAWRSTERVGIAAIILRPGSTLLFERGGVYRGTMHVRSGMSVGAYGTGPKPQLYGSLQNYADESLWQKTDTANMWLLDLGTEQGDVGNIIFDYGVEMASLGKKLNLDEVVQDLDFYYDTEKGYVYLYLSKGNPGKLYESIEIAAQGRGAVVRRNLYESSTTNLTIENLCIRYGNFGISLGPSSDVTISNCEIGYIGGCMHSETVRYGNGIEIYGNQSNITVKNNWIYQCFDAGYTNQGGKKHENVTVSNNLIEYCHYNIEVFADEGVIDTVYENNILRFPGYGFGSYNRMSSGTHQGGNIRTGTSGVPSDNFVIRNNIFDGGKYNVVYCGALSGDRSPKFEGNTWIQTGDYPVITHWESGYAVKSGGSLTAMKSAVALLDKTAKVIYE